MHMIKLINVPSLYSAMFEAVEFCKLNKDQEVEIIVPDKLSLFMEKFLFEKLNICASFNIKVSTLNRFAKKSFEVSKDKQISKIGSLLLIHKILNENIDCLNVLKSKAYSFSYAEEIFNTINQLKASKITADEMLAFDCEDEQLKNKVIDLAKVFSEYENQKAGLLDASDMFLMSSLFVGKNRTNQNILFVGFDDFTAIEYSIIEQLAIGNNVHVVNCFAKSNNQAIYNREIFEQLKNIAMIQELPFEVVESKNQSDALKQFLESNIYALKKETFLMGNLLSLKLYESNSVRQEIERVARDIRLKVIDGHKYSGTGVAVFNLTSHEDLIKEIFNKYEINYYLDTELSINKSIFYKFLCSILKYNFESYNLAHLIDVINSPFFAMEAHKKKLLIDKFVSINFVGKVSDKTNLGEGLEEDKIELLNFLKLFDFLKQESVESIINKIKSADDVLGMSSKLEELANLADLQDKILLNKSRELIFGLFDEIVKFNSSASVEEFLDVFFHVADVIKMSNLPLTIDAVKVVEADSQIEMFEDLFVVNCNAENAPSVKADCGIILDSEIDRLNFKHKLAPSIAHINKLAKLRLFNLVTMFDKTLTVSYSKNPSEIVKELKSKIKVKLSSLDEEVNLLPLQTFDFGEYLALSKWDYINYICKNNKENAKNNENLIKNKENSQLLTENLKIFNDLNVISPSHLENYFRCPLSRFLRYSLSIKPRMDNEILSFDVGNMLHEIMYAYYKKNKQVGDVYEFCKQQVFAYVDKDERLKQNVKSPILVNLIDEAVRVVEGVDYIDNNSSFKPNSEMLEYTFAGNRALKLRNIDVVGKVDRVDQFGNMMRIVDYKSGKANATLKELYYGDKLQLFLYSVAMENATKNKVVGGFYLPLHNEYKREVGNTYTLNGFFLNEEFVIKAFDNRLEPNLKSDIVNVRMLKDGTARKSSGKELDSDDLRSLKEYSKLVAEQAVDEIKSGYIAASPTKVSDPCRYCEFAQVCLRKSKGIKTRDTLAVDVSSFKEVAHE